MKRVLNVSFMKKFFKFLKYLKSNWDWDDILLVALLVLIPSLIYSCMRCSPEAFTKRDVKEYCLDKGAQECQVCIKRMSYRCDLYITLKGKEIEEFVNL